MNSVTTVQLGFLGALGVGITACWGIKGCSERTISEDFYASMNNKLELYKAVNKKPAPLITRYKFDLYRTIEEETGYWSYYNGTLTFQIQQKKLAELEKSLPENPDKWTAEQKEVHDYAIKSAAEFINTGMETENYVKSLKNDLTNFTVEINPRSKTANTSAQMPDAVKGAMLYNTAVRGRE